MGQLRSTRNVRAFKVSLPGEILSIRSGDARPTLGRGEPEPIIAGCGAARARDHPLRRAPLVQDLNEFGRSRRVAPRRGRHSELGLGQDPVARLVEDREGPLIGSSLLGFGRRPEP